MPNVGLIKRYTRVIQKDLPPPSELFDIKASHMKFVTLVVLSLSYTLMIYPIVYHLYLYPYTVKAELRLWTTETRQLY